MLPPAWKAVRTHAKGAAGFQAALAGSEIQLPPTMHATQLYQKEALWKHIFEDLENGWHPFTWISIISPDAQGASSSSTAPASRLLSGFLLSVTLLQNSSPDLWRLLTEVTARIVENSSVKVGTSLMLTFLTKFSSDTATRLQRSMEDKRLQAPKQPTTKLQQLRFRHLVAYRHLQFLHSLLQYPRARWVLNALGLPNYLQSYLSLPIPFTPAAETFHPAVQEALAFQQLSIECLRLGVDSSPTTILEQQLLRQTGQTSKEQLLPTMDVRWPTYRESLTSTLILLFSPNSSIGFAALRAFISCAQTKPGCSELLLLLSDKQNSRHLHARVFQQNQMRVPKAPGDQRGWDCSPLYIVLAHAIELYERAAGEPDRRPMTDLEAEQWGLLALILRLLITLGNTGKRHPRAERAQTVQAAGTAGEAEAETKEMDLTDEPLHLPPAPHASHSVSASEWCRSIVALYPGLTALCSALQFPSIAGRGLPTEMIEDIRRSLMLLPLPPMHPLMRIMARLHAADTASKASSILDTEKDRSVSSLIACYSAILQRCQLAVTLQLAKFSSEQQVGARATAHWDLDNRFAKLDLCQQQEGGQHAKKRPRSAEHVAHLEMAADELEKGAGSKAFMLQFPASIPFAPVPNREPPILEALPGTMVTISRKERK
jgi:hypothetical protein